MQLQTARPYPVVGTGAAQTVRAAVGGAGSGGGELQGFFVGTAATAVTLTDNGATILTATALPVGWYPFPIALVGALGATITNAANVTFSIAM